MSQVIEPHAQPPTPTGRAVRQYSKAERANACAVYDSIGSLEKTSEVLGIPMSTLAGWARDGSNISQARTQKSIELGQKFENAANLFIDLAVKKAKKANFHHLVTASGIAFDKMQISRGLPTSIVEERVEPSAVLVLMSNALGVEDPAAGAIDVTPENVIVEIGLPAENSPEGQQ